VATGRRASGTVQLADERVTDGVRHRAFALEHAGRSVPGALWTPATPEGASRPGLPLVLVGHGASGSKYQDYVRSLARMLVLEHGIAAAAIDGPVHGARRVDGGRNGQLAFLDFAAAWSSDPGLTDRMVEDWRLALDALLRLEEIDGPVGYWGLSMGTILGLPFVAADARVSAAVLGLMGATGPTSARLRADAAAIDRPVLFIVQWSDELFSRASAFELFDAIGTADKTLHANPGPHGAVPAHEFADSARFLAAQLRRLRG
jgi:pimeloyl-ACP methyl ester carboxylesterase